MLPCHSRCFTASIRSDISLRQFRPGHVCTMRNSLMAHKLRRIKNLKRELGFIKKIAEHQ